MFFMCRHMAKMSIYQAKLENMKWFAHVTFLLHVFTQHICLTLTLSLSHVCVCLTLKVLTNIHHFSHSWTKYEGQEWYEQSLNIHRKKKKKRVNLGGKITYFRFRNWSCYKYDLVLCNWFYVIHSITLMILRYLYILRKPNSEKRN